MGTLLMGGGVEWYSGVGGCRVTGGCRGVDGV